MSQPVVPSWDLFITLIAIIIIAYGVIIAHERIIVMLVSSYVGMVVATVWGSTIYEFFNGNRTILNKVWIHSTTSLFFVQLILYGAVIGVLSFRSSLAAKGSSGLATIEQVVYSVLSAGLIISTLISFMPADQQSTIINSSKIGHIVMNYQTWWVILPIIVLAFTYHKSRGSSSGE